jgi:hypothetical protein
MSASAPLRRSKAEGNMESPIYDIITLWRVPSGEFMNV